MNKQHHPRHLKVANNYLRRESGSDKKRFDNVNERLKNVKKSVRRA